MFGEEKDKKEKCTFFKFFEFIFSPNKMLGRPKGVSLKKTISLENLCLAYHSNLCSMSHNNGFYKIYSSF